MWCFSGFLFHRVAELSKVDSKPLIELFWLVDILVIVDICGETAAGVSQLPSSANASLERTLFKRKLMGADD